MGWPVRFSVVDWGTRSQGARPLSSAGGEGSWPLLGSFSSSPRFPSAYTFLYYLSLFSFGNSQYLWLYLFRENRQKWVYAVLLGTEVCFSKFWARRYIVDPKSICFVWLLVHPLRCSIWTKYRLISFQCSNLCWAVLDFIHLWDKVQKRRGAEKKCHGFNEVQLNYLSGTKLRQIQHWFIWPEGVFVCGGEGHEVFGSGMQKGHRTAMGKFRTSLTRPPRNTSSTWHGVTTVCEIRQAPWAVRLI